ncbi:MAG: hypothetical protein NW241_20445 [Bacteroidia bacterium]|nr:hypothetical protein [Bacteroidia bacterium]
MALASRRMPVFLCWMLAASGALLAQAGGPIPGACGVTGPNLVVNPEFDENNAGFTSDYTYNPAGYICAFGEYAVTSSIGPFPPNTVCYNAPGFDLRSIWIASDRNAPGTGKFFVGDPSSASGVNDNIWQQTVTVCPNTSYVFSVYAKNLYVRGAPGYSGIDPQFDLEVNGQPINGYYIDGVLSPNGEFVLPRQRRRDSTVWIQISGTWLSGPNVTSATLAVRNKIFQTQGNDLAIDGVYFGLCGQDVGVVAIGDVSQCPDSGSTVVQLSPTPATLASGWQFFEWLQNDSIVASDATPTPLLIAPTPDGSHLGDYRLKAFSDPGGSGCGNVSNKVTLFETCSFSFPVEWLSFDASPQDRQVQLNWATASELQNRGFTVEHSLDGRQYDALGFVPGGGDRQEISRYAFLTPPMAAGLHHFRLRQEDYDGAFAYSEQISVRLAPMQPYSLVVAPNPVTAASRVELIVDETQPLRAELFNASGARVAVLYQGVADAAQPVSWALPADRMPAGLYVLRLSAARFAAVQSISVSK